LFHGFDTLGSPLEGRRDLPLHLADSARTWLEHLPASQINNWDNLVRTFVGNFQDTYARPGNSWDLRACTQKTGESLRDFIRRFSKRCTELPSVAQSEIVHAFLEGTTCWDLVRELRRSPPVDSNELFDISTSFASGEEAVGAIFDGKKGKRVDDAPAEGRKSKEPQQKNKWGKKGKKPLSYGPPWAHYLGGYQDRLLSGPLGLPDLRCTAPDGMEHKDYRGEVLG
jgi:hypothetical protein